MLTHLLESSAVGAALVFGFRHGFDWDHIAALTDLTGSQATPRRSMWLATLYALGHASMVFVLGVGAILFAEQVPGSLEVVMERTVGFSLLGLGVWMAVAAVRARGVPPLQSRWMLVIGVVRRRIDRRRTPSTSIVVIEHTHHHGHGRSMHDHDHPGSVAMHDSELCDLSDVMVQHRHAHRHVAVVSAAPFTRYGSRSAFGVGLLHGIGAETPTQVLVVVAAANASGRAASISLLVCFVVGLVVSNSVVAGASTFGFRRVMTYPAVAGGLAAVTAGFSLVVGGLLLSGHSAALPAIFGG